MKAKKNIGIGYYLFWTIMVLMASVIAIFILGKVIPNSLLPYRDMISNTTLYTDKKVVPNDMDIEITPARMKDEMYDSNDGNKSTQNFMSSNTGTKPNLIITNDTNKSLFNKANIIPLGQFTNSAGTTFVAGSLEFDGSFPSDFELESKLDALVSVKLSFGWDNLPSFQEIKDHNSSSQLSITLSNLEILDFMVTINDNGNPSDDRRIKKIVKDYIYALFKNQNIPSNIISISQRRLASSYLSRNFNSINLSAQPQ